MPSTSIQDTLHRGKPQAVLADYLQHGGYDQHLRKLRHALEAQQASMLASAARHFPASTKVTGPSGGYFLWFEFPEQVDALPLFQLALAQGISLAPGPIFSATRRFSDCARLSYRYPWDVQSEQALAVLDAFTPPADPGNAGRTTFV